MKKNRIYLYLSPGLTVCLRLTRVSAPRAAVISTPLRLERRRRRVTGGEFDRKRASEPRGCFAARLASSDGDVCDRCSDFSFSLSAVSGRETSLRCTCHGLVCSSSCCFAFASASRSPSSHSAETVLLSNSSMSASTPSRPDFRTSVVSLTIADTKRSNVRPRSDAAPAVRSDYVVKIIYPLHKIELN